MTMKELLDLVNKDKRKEKRLKTIQTLVIEMGVAVVVGAAAGILTALYLEKKTHKDLKKIINTVEALKDTIHTKAEKVKDTTAHAAQQVVHGMKDAHEKVDGISTDIVNGCHEIAQDIHKTAEAISKE